FIYTDQCSKSASLDVGSNRIRYLGGDGKYKLLNGNLGLSNHNYYQKHQVYQPVFRAIWESLRDLKIATRTLEQIDNLDAFKYSPFKTLSTEQRDGVKAILKSLLDESYRYTMIEGGAVSAKTVMVVYLFKLIKTTFEDFELSNL